MIGALITALAIVALYRMATTVVRLAALLLRVCLALYCVFVVAVRENDLVGGIAGASALLICAYVMAG
ncbi:hypothetical protein [Bradyrhizobium sp. BRP23]|uniref:hypothetical protein n=1 Tax=Bradyrhizobium sp. BRP23 TaxID=2793820 RepID=UPI001CD5B399|nr:hypothetical protein [Bradyrhizobium sp. BRP23]MCA1419473.1 hypothetical protein [Bradyrhizobium sp. BRP23]